MHAYTLLASVSLKEVYYSRARRRRVKIPLLERGASRSIKSCRDAHTPLWLNCCTAADRRVVVFETSCAFISSLAYVIRTRSECTAHRYPSGCEQITQRINNNQRGVRADTPPIMSNDMCRNYSKTRCEAWRAPAVFLTQTQRSSTLGLCNWAKFLAAFYGFSQTTRSRALQ